MALAAVAYVAGMVEPPVRSQRRQQDHAGAEQRRHQDQRDHVGRQAPGLPTIIKRPDKCIASRTLLLRELAPGTLLLGCGVGVRCPLRPQAVGRPRRSGRSIEIFGTYGHSVTALAVEPCTGATPIRGGWLCGSGVSFPRLVEHSWWPPDHRESCRWQRGRGCPRYISATSAFQTCVC